MSDAQLVGDLQGAADLLRGLDEVNGKVACIGFCSGGRQTLLFAAQRRLDVAADCWGGFTDRATRRRGDRRAAPAPADRPAEGLHCPLLVVVGGQDQNPSPEAAARRHARAARAGQGRAPDVYEDAGHAFFADYRPNYVEAAAHRLWDELQELWAEHLR